MQSEILQIITDLVMQVLRNRIKKKVSETQSRSVSPMIYIRTNTTGLTTNYLKHLLLLKFYQSICFKCEFDVTQTRAMHL